MDKQTTASHQNLSAIRKELLERIKKITYQLSILMATQQNNSAAYI